MKKLLTAALMFCGLLNGAEMTETVIVIDTTQGRIECTLRPDIAPKACENMTKLAEKGYYDGVVFHRIIPNFMIQGGDPTGTGAGGESIWGKEFEDEFDPSLKFDRPYLLAMANRGPATNGSQFFITTAKTEWLNGNHTIFGEVTTGEDVVKKLEAQGSPSGQTLSKQEITKMRVKKAG